MNEMEVTVLENIAKYLSMASRAQEPFEYIDVIGDCANGLKNVSRRVSNRAIGESLESIGEGLKELIEGKTLVDVKLRLEQDSDRVIDLLNLLEL